jgi:DNA-binding CsgD family transcriptional regulator/tetratricopeptide (TPR) repeat protein
MARLDADLDNIRAALSWSVSERGDPKIGLRLAGALGWYWEHQGHFAEGTQWLRDVLAQADRNDRSIIRGKALFALGELADELGDIYASASLEESVEIFSERGEVRLHAYALLVLSRMKAHLSGSLAREMAAQAADTLRALSDKWGIAYALEVMATIDTLLEDVGGAQVHDQESLALYKELGDKSYTATALQRLGAHALNMGDLPQARTYLDEAVALSQEIGHHFNLGLTLFINGVVHHQTGDYSLAEATFQQAVVIFDILGDRGRAGALTRHAAYAACRLGRLERALALLNEAAVMLQGVGRVWHVALTTMAAGKIAATLGDWQLAARALAAPLAVFSDGVNVTNAMPDDIAEYNDLLAGVRANLTEEGFARLVGGAPLSLESALAEVSALMSAPHAAPEQHHTPAPARKPEEYPAKLSKREVELLRLVALGLSNVEVAARLFLSTNTVRAHLYSIYSKINVTSRTAAARFAVEHGLV